MQKYYISAGCKGFLKHMDMKEHTNYSPTLFSKQQNLSKCFDDKETAEVYIKDITVWLNASSKLSSEITTRCQYVIDNWHQFPDTITRADYINKGFHYDFFSPHQLGSKEHFSGTTWNGFTSQKKRSISLAKACTLIKKLKIVEGECEVMFYPKKVTKIGWVDSPANIKHLGDRIYCNCCGGVIPGIKYLKCKPVSYNSNPSYICAFCMDRLANEVKHIIAAASPELKEQYAKDRFMSKL